ncbi:MAG: ATP-dependent metallopeptidase FtsH/Yme1/Tma family protein, partial [Candidatus Cloacimonetes bacterium]|nr:ATP-dependent metallopeptidase FtsH/Yme1/Tma family protein [Candidatus Cloacimonadota bacterium]
LANLVNEAALIAARLDKKAVAMDDFEEAKDKVTLGKERKSKVISDEEKRITAYHEIGHVLCSIFQTKTEPVHKVSIIPRGITGGATFFLQTDRSYYSRTFLHQTLIQLMGGRCAEELIFDELTTGAGNDLQRATDLAKKMVCSYGMSDRVGPMTVGKENTQVFLGKELGSREVFSEDTARLVDSEIRNLITESHQIASDILSTRRDILKNLAEELLEKETLGADEIYNLVLESVNDKEKEDIEKKYKRALELKLDTSEDEEDEEKDNPTPTEKEIDEENTTPTDTHETDEDEDNDNE